MEEIWKDIPEFKGLYQASTKGKIRSLDHIRKNGTNQYVHITEVCQGKLKSTCGYSFKYLEKE